MSYNPKVVAIMCTYGRFKCVQRSLSMFIDQTYDNKELIIFNTAKIPLQLNSKLYSENISIINQSICSETNQDYINIGQVRRDSLKYMNGDIYICWDDDDYYMPFHIKQGIEFLYKTNKLAWKPKKSYFTYDGGKTYNLSINNMEASILVKKEVFNYVNFKDGTGDEHISWLKYLRDHNELSENDNITPFESYAYVWGDGQHKQSGNINNPNNFNEHKKCSTDFGKTDLNYVNSTNLYYDLYRSNQFNVKLKNELELCISNKVNENIKKYI